MEATTGIRTKLGSVAKHAVFLTESIKFLVYNDNGQHHCKAQQSPAFESFQINVSRVLLSKHSFGMSGENNVPVYVFVPLGTLLEHVKPI